MNSKEPLHVTNPDCQAHHINGRLLSLFCGALIFVGLTFPNTIWAQTARTTTNKMDDPRLPSGFVTSISLQDDAGLGPAPSDIIEKIPGVYVRRQSSDGQSAFVQVRGGNPRQLIVLLNGLRIKPSAGLGFDLGVLSTAGLTQMNLYRGGAGAIFGAGALTGALNLTIGPPSRVLGTRSKISHTLGSFGLHRTQASVDVVPSKNSAATFAASYRQATGDFPFVDRQGVADQRVNNAHQNIQLVSAARWKNQRNVWRVAALFNKGSAGVPGPSEFQRQFSSAQVEHEHLMTSTSWLHRGLFEGDWGVFDLTWNSGIQWRGQTYENPRAFLGGGAFSNESLSLGVETQLKGQWFLFKRNFLTTQLELRREMYQNRVLGQSDEVDARRMTAAMGISDEQLFFSGALSLIASLRMEWVDNQPTSQPSLLLPAMGLIARPASWFRIKTNVARTARVPDFDELYLAQETVRGNPSLEAERAWVADAGLDLSFKSLAMESVVFAQNIEQMILFVPKTAYLVQATNVGQAIHYGTEQTVSWHPTKRLQLDGGYTLTIANFNNARQTPLPNQPRHQFDVDGVIDLRNLPGSTWLDAFSLNVGWRWRSQIYLDNFARLDNPAVHTVRMGLNMAWRKWAVRAKVQNLLDEQRALDSLQRPLPGRRFYLSVRYAFETNP